MAQHIDSVASSSIACVTKDEFLARCLNGMAILCSGQYDISKGIEKFTGSPWSHVATLIWIEPAQAWGVLEATKGHGVHIGHLDHYLDTYNGDIVLTDVPELTIADKLTMLETQFALIDDGYDTEQEVSMVAHKLIKLFPVIEGKNELFCSGLYEVGRAKTSKPLLWRGPGMASPEQVWTDPSIVPVCALVKS